MLINRLRWVYIDVMNSKKRGRPRSGVETVAMTRRVPVELVEKVDGFFKAAKEGGSDPFKAISEWFLKTYGVRVDNGLGAKEAAASSPVGCGSGELEVKKKEVAALLGTIGELEEKVKYWEERFEKAVRATEHQMAHYWRDRALKAEGRARQLEDMG